MNQKKLDLRIAIRNTLYTDDACRTDLMKRIAWSLNVLRALNANKSRYFINAPPLKPNCAKLMESGRLTAMMDALFQTILRKACGWLEDGGPSLTAFKAMLIGFTSCSITSDPPPWVMRYFLLQICSRPVPCQAGCVLWRLRIVAWDKATYMPILWRCTTCFGRWTPKLAVYLSWGKGGTQEDVPGQQQKLWAWIVSLQSLSWDMFGFSEFKGGSFWGLSGTVTISSLSMAPPRSRISNVSRPGATQLNSGFLGKAVLCCMWGVYFWTTYCKASTGT